MSYDGMIASTDSGVATTQAELGAIADERYGTPLLNASTWSLATHRSAVSMLAGTRSELVRWSQEKAVSLSLAAAALVFLADLFTPLGVASGVPYSLAVLLALNAKSRQFAISFAVLCSVLTVCDLFTGPGRGGSELWKVLTNRFLALSMIWITLTLGMMRQRADQLRRDAEALTRRHLADLAHMSRMRTAGQLAAHLGSRAESTTRRNFAPVRGSPVNWSPTVSRRIDH